MSQPDTPNRRQILFGAAMTAGAVAAAQTAAAQTRGAGPDLSGKTILITGTSSGFGRLGAEHYARLGARVFASMRNTPRPEADALRDLAAADDLAIEVLEIDVTSDMQVARGVADALARADGKIDVLINNAGIGITGPVEVQDMEATKLAFDTNVFGCHRMARAVLSAMRAAGEGQIFSISSQLGRVILPGGGHYSATKFALEAMSEQMAYELAPHGVEVTIIQPGGYPTEIWENRVRYNEALLARVEDERLKAYPELVASMTGGGERPTDPMDVPRAIAEIIAMPKGARPLRRAVHPTSRPQEAVNEAMRTAQIGFLGESPFGPLIRAVHD